MVMLTFFFKNPIGALTSKAYAFLARPWELEKVTVFDFLDSFGSSLYLDCRGSEILRILPCISSENEWISDRARFFYDAINVQNITSPMFFNKTLGFFEIRSWLEFTLFVKYLSIFFLKISEFKAYTGFINIAVDEDVDLYTLYSLNKLSSSFDYLTNRSKFLIENKSLNLDFYDDFFLINNDYFFNSYSFLDKINSKLINGIFLIELYLIGYNIRCEHPLFFYKLLEWKKKHLNFKCFVFGVPFGVSFKSIGNTQKDLINFFFNRSKSFQVFKNKKLVWKNEQFRVYNKKFIFLIGSAFLNRNEFVVYDQFFKDFGRKIKAFGFSFLYKKIFYSLVQLNSIYLGMKPDFRMDVRTLVLQEKSNMLLSRNFFFKNSGFLLNALGSLVFENSFFFTSKEKTKYFQTIDLLKLYVGHNISSLYAVKDNVVNIILPSTFIYERDSCFINLFGKFLNAGLVHNPRSGLRKNSWVIYDYMLNSLVLKNQKICLKSLDFFLNIANFVNKTLDFDKSLYLEDSAVLKYIENIEEVVADIRQPISKNVGYLLSNNNLFFYDLNNSYFITGITLLSKNINMAYTRFLSVEIV